MQLAEMKFGRKSNHQLATPVIWLFLILEKPGFII
jgi:hypothetical protein